MPSPNSTRKANLFSNLPTATQVQPETATTATKVSSDTDSPPENLQITSPWARSIHHNGSVNKVPVPPRSSAIPSPKINTTNARLITNHKGGPVIGWTGVMILILIVAVPLATLLWGSYQGWPAYLPISAPARFQIDKFIAGSPLPKRPSMLLSTVLLQMQQIKNFKQQLIVKTTQIDGQAEFNLELSGPVRVDTGLQIQLAAASKWQLSADIPAALSIAQLIYRQGILSLQFERADPSVHYNFQSLVNRPVYFNLNPSPGNITSQDLVVAQTKHTPGEFALTKIRNQKLRQLFIDYYHIILERMVLADTLEANSGPLYLLQAEMKKDELITFIKELLVIYQESQPTPLVSQANLQEFYRLLADSTDTVMITIQVNRRTLQLTKIELDTQVYPIQTANNPLLPEMFLYSPQAMNVKVEYRISDINRPVSLPLHPENGITAAQANWAEMISEPLLQPILQKRNLQF